MKYGPIVHSRESVQEATLRTGPQNKTNVST